MDRVGARPSQGWRAGLYGVRMKFRLIAAPVERGDLNRIFSLFEVAQFLEIAVEDLALRGKLSGNVSLDGYTFEVVRNSVQGSSFK